MWNLIYDKFGDFSILAFLGAFAWGWNKVTGIDSKFKALELDLVKNYVTKTELKIVEDKIDNLSEHISMKLENINNNILQILQNRA